MLKEIRPFVIALIIIAALYASVASAAPTSRIERTLIPETDNTYDLGSALKYWKSIFTNELCLSGDCKSAWPTVAGSASTTLLSDNNTWTGLNVFGKATSTSFFSTTASSTNLATTNFLFGGLLGNSWDDFCVAITGSSALCDGSDATGAGGAAAVATSTNETAGRLAYWTSTSGTPATLGEVATSSLTINAPLTSAGTPGFVVSGSGWTLDIDDIKAADLDLTDITLNDFTNDSNYLVNTRQLTIAGTANQIDSSAGAQNLTADRTWTLSLPNHVIFPSSFQVTRATTTHATTTNLDITSLLTFNGVTGNEWTDFCTTITGGAGLCDGTDATGSGGAAAVATSSAETSTYVPFWTSTAGTPATLSGGEAAFVYDSTLDKLTVTNASSTNLSVTGGAIFLGSKRIYDNALGGLDFTVSGGVTDAFGYDTDSVDSVFAFTAPTVDTGQGANELYDMDQNVLTTSNVTFANGTSTNWFSTTASSTSLFSTLATITSGIFRDLLRIPIFANPTISTAGDIAIDSTQASSSIKYHDGTAERTLHPFFDKPTIHASSTLAYDGAYGASGTTTYLMWNPSRAVTLVDIYCKTDVGTAWYEIGTGSATSTVQCTTSGALSSTDVTFTMRANVFEAVGRQSSNPSRITVTPTFRWDE